MMRFLAGYLRLVVVILLAALALVAGALAAAPALPQGRQVAYMSNCQGGWDIYLLDAARGTSRNVTRSAVDESALMWSPGGHEIGYVYYTGAQPNVIVFDPFTGRQRPGAPQQEAWLNGIVQAVPVRGEWSLDGARRVYELANEIYIMDARGQVRQITQDAFYDQSPAWSPDSSQIVFASNRDDNLDIYVMDADGANSRRLTAADARESSPRWSPDGQQIVFISQRDGSSEIYLMNRDGGGARRLTVNDCWDDRPAWRP